MRRFVTFNVALVWVLALVVLSAQHELDVIVDVARWSPSALPVGALFVALTCFWGFRATFVWTTGGALRPGELALASVVMLGLPMLCCVSLFLLLSAVGADPF